MMGISRLSGRLAALAVVLSASSVPAVAADGVGLVLEVSGKTKPALAPYGELGADGSISLSDGARLKAVHYRSCRTVTVSGGTLKVGAEDFDVSAAHVDADQKTACPRRTAARTPRAGDAGTGGIVMRGAAPAGSGGGAAALLQRGPSSVVVSPSETFVFVGAKFADVRLVRLVRDDKPVAEWQAGKSHSWATPKDALKAGDSAKLVFLMKGDRPAVEQPIKVLHDEPGGGPKITVINVD
jgi:hypothetical protein